MTTHKRPETDRAILAQDHQINALGRHMSELEAQADIVAAENANHTAALAGLEARMAALYAEAGLARPDAAALEAVEVLPSLRLTAAEEDAIRSRIPNLALELEIPDQGVSWSHYMAQIDRYADRVGLDVTRDPVLCLLAPERAKAVLADYDAVFGPVRWRTADFVTLIIACAAGVLAARVLGPIVRELAAEGGTKVLPFVLKTALPQIKETLTKIVAEDDTAEGEDGRREPSLLQRLAAAILAALDEVAPLVKEAGTLVSAKAKPPKGKPNPKDARKDSRDIIVALMQPILAEVMPDDIKQKLPTTKPVADLLLKYGFDQDALVSLSLGPAAAEMVIRVYCAMTVHADGAGKKADVVVAMHQASMLTLAHALLSAGNLALVTVTKNPKHLNPMQYVALARRLIALLKLAAERDQKIQEQLTEGWEALLADSRALEPASRAPGLVAPPAG